MAGTSREFMQLQYSLLFSMFRVECNKYNCPPAQLKFLYKMLIRACSLRCKMLFYFLDYLTELPVIVFGFFGLLCKCFSI